MTASPAFGSVHQPRPAQSCRNRLGYSAEHPHTCRHRYTCTGPPHSRPGSANRVGQPVNQCRSGREHHYTTHQRRRSVRQGQFLMRTYISATQGRVRTFRHQDSAPFSSRRSGAPTAVTHNVGYLVKRSRRHRLCSCAIACPGMTLATGLVGRHQVAHHKQTVSPLLQQYCGAPPVRRTCGARIQT